MLLPWPRFWGGRAPRRGWWPCLREAKQRHFGYAAELLWQREGPGSAQLLGLDQKQEVLGDAGHRCSGMLGAGGAAGVAGWGTASSQDAGMDGWADGQRRMGRPPGCCRPQHGTGWVPRAVVGWQMGARPTVL